MVSRSNRNGVAQMDDLPHLISLNEASKVTSLSRTMINRMRAEGRFPKAVALGEKRVAFSREEVIAWIVARLAERAA